MARNICCPLVQLSIERSIWLRSEWTPAPSVPQAIEKTATKGRRIEDTMDIGSHHSAIPGDCSLSSDFHSCEVLNIKERLNSLPTNGLSHMTFVSLNWASTFSINPL